MSAVAWSREQLGGAFREPWRVWRSGGMHAHPSEEPAGAGARGEPNPSGEVGELPRPTGQREEGEDGGRAPVLWHQVQPHDDWATLVARYNIAEPRALLEANGLTEPRALVPGDWVCVPCHLARPVWELRLDEAEETLNA